MNAQGTYNGEKYYDGGDCNAGVGGRRLSSVRRTSQVMAAADYLANSHSQAFTGRYRVGIDNDTITGGVLSVWQSVLDRHDRSNVLFVDGHVSGVSYAFVKNEIDNNAPANDTRNGNKSVFFDKMRQY